MKKKISIFNFDEEAEAFVAHEDLSNYDSGERRALCLVQQKRIFRCPPGKSAG